MKSRLLIFTIGIVSGIILVLIVAVWAAFKMPSWLVIDEEAHQANIAVILGGGGGSRFRTGLSLYDRGLVDQLLLVDIKKAAWNSILERFCSDCKADGKDVVILEGSTNTLTDAELVSQYCAAHGIDSILVVTDPYHTRRASIIFNSQFKESDVEISVVSSGDFMGKLSPDEKWWQDDPTLKVIFGEISRISIILFRKEKSPSDT
jgi:uncharacterized SAM-binding protein YcdF (DUF218 family)